MTVIALVWTRIPLLLLRSAEYGLLDSIRKKESTDTRGREFVARETEDVWIVTVSVVMSYDFYYLLKTL
jgi:hypothetical protein